MNRFLATFFVAWALIAPAGLLFALPPRNDCPTCVFPGEEWEIVPRGGLAGLGWDADALARVRDFVRDSANSTGIVVADRGRIVFQYGDIEGVVRIWPPCARASWRCCTATGSRTAPST